MKILNLGSLNIDKVYSVPHFVEAGETLSSTKMETFSGGKGLNQSIALARAGATVYHAGAIGEDGEGLRQLMADAGVHTDYLQTLPVVTGHAVIQLTPKGQNCIIISAGANGELTEAYIDSALSNFEAGDLLLVQNETNNVPYAIRRAKEKGMKVAFNASPISEALLQYPLELVDYYLINEVEGKALAGEEAKTNEEILAALKKRFPAAAIVLTVGKDGVLYQFGEERASHGIYDVPVADTTAAGDTFCGYFLACTAKGLPAAEALRMASLASSLAVSKKGAANSIPTWSEVEQFGDSAKLI
ncbi:MAG TPA: ribokinase [Candidatus Pygmaiobacter gallistercoris]|nr:ribokinase [Candidatus Pygmaiobacter gallistercoris]